VALLHRNHRPGERPPRHRVRDGIRRFGVEGTPLLGGVGARHVLDEGRLEELILAVLHRGAAVAPVRLHRTEHVVVERDHVRGVLEQIGRGQDSWACWSSVRWSTRLRNR
jgi:hypothetical protein